MSGGRGTGQALVLVGEDERDASTNAVSTCQPAWACNTLSALHNGPPVRPKSWSGTATTNGADRACAEDRLLRRALPALWVVEVAGVERHGADRVVPASTG